MPRTSGCGGRGFEFELAVCRVVGGCPGGMPTGAGAPRGSDVLQAARPLLAAGLGRPPGAQGSSWPSTAQVGFGFKASRLGLLFGKVLGAAALAGQPDSTRRRVGDDSASVSAPGGGPVSLRPGSQGLPNGPNILINFRLILP